MDQAQHERPAHTRVGVMVILNARGADSVTLRAQDAQAPWHGQGARVRAGPTRVDEAVDVADESRDLRADRVVQRGGAAEETSQGATTRLGLTADPHTRAEERCSMQLVTVAEGLTFFVSLAVILYRWLQ
jgi:DNA-binding ferritin-like protein